MAPKASSYGTPNLKTLSHAAGIYADMTVDGPEIGTLVVVVDRARNLPNLRTMGKQDPYCAARLGKDAKKTNTDMRGGQTPRWDQELRFTVHDSPDYLNLKISVFNDDKKTDLIGEGWIDLNGVIRPGGGQADAWHQLNIRGRYAGEIRIEITYWDSRPKAEKPKKQSNTAATRSQTQPQPQTHAAGPRQPAGRRPLPTNPAQSSRASAVPVAHPDNFHIPAMDERALPIPTNTQFGEAFGTNDEETYGEVSGYASQDVTGEHYRVPSHGHYEDQFVQPSELHHDAYPIENTGDFQSLHVDDQHIFSNNPSQSTQYPSHHNSSFLRHDRVQALSDTYNTRPTPLTDQPQAHSAPQLGSDEMYYEPVEHQYSQQGYLGDRFASSPPTYESFLPNYIHRDDQLSGHQNAFPHGYQSQVPNGQQPPPPPPPAHRNSAPAVPGQRVPPPPRPMSGIVSLPTQLPMNGQHYSTNDQQNGRSWKSTRPIYDHQVDIYDPAPPATTLPYPLHSQRSDTHPPSHHNLPHPSFPSHLSHDAEPAIRPRDELSYDPRQNYDTEGSASLPHVPEVYRQAPVPSNYQQPRPVSYAGQSNPTYFGYSEENGDQYHDSPPVVKPRAISPSARRPVPLHTTPRKSVSPHPTPEHTSSSTPYSPDSFDLLNPTHASQVSGGQLGRDPTPMYSSPLGTPDKLNNAHVRVQAETRSDEPIITTDGRVRDPSDHLPVSSYAPEPERKGADKNRPSTIINVKNRFGPREARTIPTPTRGSATSSLSNTPIPSVASDRRPKRLSGQGIHGSSPLGPSHANTLNTSGYNLSSPYPPPVPGKIPLSPVDDYSPGGSMSALSEEMRSIDLNAIPVSRKQRNSRFGP